mgnify:FL=1|tara:strand:- start:444 stop:680 length:237 start_codon:yes stop_codon:yes gene_type:complete
MANKKDKKTKGKKQKLAIMIAIGKPKEMAYGGMASGKKHMYAASKGMVVENAGLKALKASGEKGKEAYEKITGKSASV